MFRPSNPSDPQMTRIEFQNWDAERDTQKVDFPYIHLKRSELKLLKNVAKGEVKKTDKNEKDAIRLRNLVFIRIFSTDYSNGDDIEFCQIRERGQNYLMYIKTVRRQKRIEWIRYIITTAIAVIALIKSFLPEIRAIVERLGLIA